MRRFRWLFPTGEYSQMPLETLLFAINRIPGLGIKDKLHIIAQCKSLLPGEKIQFHLLSGKQEIIRER